MRLFLAWQVEVLKHAGYFYKTKPMVFRYNFDSTTASSRNVQPPTRISVHWEKALYELYPSKRRVARDEEDEMGQMELTNSNNYNRPNHLPLLFQICTPLKV